MNTWSGVGVFIMTKKTIEPAEKFLKQTIIDYTESEPYQDLLKQIKAERSSVITGQIAGSSNAMLIAELAKKTKKTDYGDHRRTKRRVFNA
jgi:hypothetical protein